MNFEVVPSKVEEITESELSPEQNAIHIARDKARWVAGHNPGCFVLGADTIVVLDQEIIGQPRDKADAFHILCKLAGKQHQVITGMIVISPEAAEYSTAVISTVTLRSVTEKEIQDYIATEEPLDKAGAYAIQGEGSFLVESWDGSWSNIVGLPLEALPRLLEQAGYPIPSKN